MKQVVTAGIDVSAKELAVAARRDGKLLGIARFPNDVKGHEALIRSLCRGGRKVRVALEATGVYSLDVALALHRAPGIEVMVANPRAVKDFGDALLKRTKTDPEDALVILEFVERMPFEAWVPPSAAALLLRSLARRIKALKNEVTAERNRLHASEYLAEASEIISNDIEVNLRHLERRIALLSRDALAVVQGDAELHRCYQLMITTRGIAKTSAIQLLGELAILAADMRAAQWVAHAGLDPRQFQSGSSIEKPARISRVGNQRIRAALYMPALVAIQRDANVRAFYQALLARGKKPLQAIVAVMRKLLCCLHAMLRLNVPYNSEKFYRPVDLQESA